MTDKYPWQEQETLRRLYHGEEMTQAEVAEELGCHTDTVKKWMKRHGIETRPSYIGERPWADKERLESLYWDEELTTTQIAERLGCSRRNINTWLNRHEIDQRPLSESLVIASRDSIMFDVTQYGYERCYIHYRSKKESFLMHRLLAVAEYGFEAVCEREVHHKNGIKWDNRPDNIEVLTPAEHRAKHPVEERDYDGRIRKLGFVPSPDGAAFVEGGGR